MRRIIYSLAISVSAFAQTFAVTGAYQYSQPQAPVVYPNRHNWYNKGNQINAINRNAPPAGAPGTCAGMIAGMRLSFLTNAPGLTASLNGFRPFPGSGWYDDVSSAPADSRSGVWTAGAFNSTGQTLRLTPSPDSGEPLTGGGGYLLHIVGKDQPKVEIRYDGGLTEVDPGPLRVPLSPAIEGSNGTTGFYNRSGYDRHLSVIDRDNCVAIDLYGVNYYEGKIRASSGAVFDLLAGDHQRPYFWTSGAVAGTPLGAFLLDWDEIDAEIAGSSRGGHAFPWAMWGAYGLTGSTGVASHHQYGSGCGVGADAPTKPPFGARVRLKANYDVETFLASARAASTNPLSEAGANRLRVLLNNLKKFGLVYTDGSYTPDLWVLGDSRAEYGMYYQLVNNGPRISTDFDFPQVTTPIYQDCPGKLHPGTAFGPVPAIGSFALASGAGSAGSPVSPGTAVTLAWTVTDAANRLRWVVDGAGGGPGLVDMNPDMTAPGSVVVRPLKTTTYWLMVQSGAENGRKVSAPVAVFVR